MSLLLSLVALATAVPAHSQVIISSADYPLAALREHREGTVRYQLTISDQGVPIRCDITSSSGSADLDRETCAALTQRAHFSPMLDSHRQPIASIFRNQVNWTLPGSRPPKDAPKGAVDIVATVNRLPDGFEDPTIARVTVLVDQHGALSECNPWAPPVFVEKKIKTAALKIADKLGSTACSIVESQLKPSAALDGQGQAIRSLQPVTVLFEVRPSGR